jgi:hypothetical protein
MQINGHIEFAITASTPDRVDAEMPIQAGLLNRYSERIPRCLQR